MASAHFNVNNRMRVPSVTTFGWGVVFLLLGAVIKCPDSIGTASQMLSLVLRASYCVNFRLACSSACCVMDFFFFICGPTCALQRGAVRDRSSTTRMRCVAPGCGFCLILAQGFRSTALFCTRLRRRVISESSAMKKKKKKFRIFGAFASPSAQAVATSCALPIAYLLQPFVHCLNRHVWHTRGRRACLTRAPPPLASVTH